MCAIPNSTPCRKTANMILVMITPLCGGESFGFQTIMKGDFLGREYIKIITNVRVVHCVFIQRGVALAPHHKRTKWPTDPIATFSRLI